jgi:hypothetical protein
MKNTSRRVQQILTRVLFIASPFLGVLLVYIHKAKFSLQNIFNAQMATDAASRAQSWLLSGAHAARAHVAPVGGVGAPRSIVCRRRAARPCRSPRDSSIAAGAIRRFASTTTACLWYARSAATSEWRPAGAHVVPTLTQFVPKHRA